MTYPTFDAVLALPANEHRRLLASGDPPERLWAAWAVALRLGADAVPALSGGDALRAPPGVRRHLLVVVAGFGEREVLRAVASGGDLPEVRATACTYFIRTAPRSTDGETVTFATKHLFSEAREVREAVLGEQYAGRLQLPEAVLLRALVDVDRGNRALAARCVGQAELLSDDAVGALIEASSQEPEAEQRRAIFGMLPRAAYPLLFDRLRAGSAARLFEVLDLARERAGTLPWAELRGLASSADPGVVCRLLRLLGSPLPDEAFLWAAHGCAGPGCGERADRAVRADVEEAAWRARSLLRADLSTRTVGLLDRATVARLARVFEEEHAALVAEAEYEFGDGDPGGDITAEPGFHDLRQDIADVRRCIALLVGVGETSDTP